MIRRLIIEATAPYRLVRQAVGLVRQELRTMKAMLEDWADDQDPYGDWPEVDDELAGVV